MRGRLSLEEYLDTPESLYPTELRYGFLVREAAPSLSHQSVVLTIASELRRHVRAHGLGRVFASPVDVILDSGRSLVLQPDVAFISSDRFKLLSKQIRGAPDLVVEVLSPGTARRDRGAKVRLYRRYGVRECWLVDPIARTVRVFDWSRRPFTRTLFSREHTIASAVLPQLRLRVPEVFEI